MIKQALSFLATAALLLVSGRAAADPPPPAAGAVAAHVDGDAPAEDESAFRTGVTGHRYRVKFDPASKVSLTAAATVAHDGEGSAVMAFEAGFRFGYRKLYQYGSGPGRILWQVDHQITTGTVRPFVRPAADVPSLDATLYRATLLRHSESPSIVLPSSPPATIPFPFDVGLDVELGRVTVPITPVVLPGFASPQPWVHVSVVRTSFTLDPWRTGEPGRSLALGVGVRYDVDIYPAPTLNSPRFVHRIAPLTSGSVRFRYQTDDGLLLLDAFAEAAPHWTSENQWAFLANGNVRLDRTLIAINDRPISAFAEVGYRYLPEGAGAPALHDLHGTLGVAASLSLK